MCCGSGSCTKIPWNWASMFNSSINAINSSWDISDANVNVLLWHPFLRKNFSLFFTYILDAGLSPTSTTAKPGIMFLSDKPLMSFKAIWVSFSTTGLEYNILELMASPVFIVLNLFFYQCILIFLMLGFLL